MSDRISCYQEYIEEFSTQRQWEIYKEQREEIERLQGDIDSVVLCRMCHKPDAGCQCTHGTPDTWMSPVETIRFMDEEIERLSVYEACIQTESCGCYAHLKDEIERLREENAELRNKVAIYELAAEKLDAGKVGGDDE